MVEEVLEDATVIGRDVWEGPGGEDAVGGAREEGHGTASWARVLLAGGALHHVRLLSTSQRPQHCRLGWSVLVGENRWSNCENCHNEYLVVVLQSLGGIFHVCRN